jgi:hexulose-6-phosphate isomerase
MRPINRREFGAVLGAAAVLKADVPKTGARLAKGICDTIFPDNMPLSERFLAAKNAGFDGVELPVGGEIKLTSTPDQLKRTADAAHRAGVTVVSLWVSEPTWTHPLNSPDAAVRAAGVESVAKCLEFARLLNCGAILLIPARLGNGPKFHVGYQATWDRVTAEVKKLIPVAEQKKVIITPENVWNKWLVSPLEMRAFVDQFKSPWLQTHFDIGNVMQYGYPQDWILTLGPRIKRVHAKDYKLSDKAEQGRFVGLLEGDVDWKEVMGALTKVGYHGFISPEVDYDANDPDQLKKVSRALDQILAMA